MAFCVKCGAEIPEGEKLCSACGKALLEREEALRKEREEREKKEKALYEASVEGEANHILVLGVISVIMALVPLNYIFFVRFQRLIFFWSGRWVVVRLLNLLLGWRAMTAMGAIILGSVAGSRFDDVNDRCDAVIDDRLKTGEKLAKIAVKIGVIVLILWTIYFIAGGPIVALMDPRGAF